MSQNHIRKILSCLLFYTYAFAAMSADYIYSSTEASSISGKSFAAGDIITLRDGEWNNKALRLRGNGTQANPIIIRAQNAGKVIFTGSSTLSIEGKHIEISGFLFEGNSTVGKNHVITFAKTSSNCRLTDSAIRNYNMVNQSAWPDTDNKWISINGAYNRVDHCYFENKGNIGTLLVVWLVSGQPAYHQIDSNHFYKRVALLDDDDKELNGQETIRIGDSNTSMTNAYCTVENNFFEECDGEIEIISNKSCGNIYRNNVFYNNNGMLTLRHGNNCEVYGNYFLGRNLAKSGGVRIIGENHKVYNNYFQDIKGSGYRSSLCMVNGKSNSTLSEYYQVKNAFVAFNTFYNCSNVFTIGFDGGKDLAPIGCTVAHNVIYATGNSQTGVNMTNPESQITWKNNLMYQGKFTDFTPTTDQFVRTSSNLNFEQSSSSYGIYQPTNQSTISSGYKTTEYPGILTDLQGRSRPEQRMIGSFELKGSPIIPMPIPGNTGCSFINKNSSNINLSKTDNRKSLISEFHISGNQLYIKSEVKGLSLSIYDFRGQLVFTQKDKEGSDTRVFHLPSILKGIYLFSFTDGFASDTRRIILQ